MLLHISRVICGFPPPEEQHLTSSGFSDDAFVQKGNYWVGYNKISATEHFHSNESITLSTPSDYIHLDNLQTLVKRWQGPISCALFTPGTDFKDALRKIRHLRECIPGTSALIQKFVTFHLFFPKEHIPHRLNEYTLDGIQRLVSVNCNHPPPIRRASTYRSRLRLNFPINVARNIAREAAKTHFVLVSDIELYPSPDFIPKFLRFLRYRSNWIEKTSPRRVYVLPVFELDGSVRELPSTKSELISLLGKKLAISFHAKVCDLCHRIPHYEKWVAGSWNLQYFQQNGYDMPLDIHTVVKHKTQSALWEPFYVGTQSDPVFDERVTWEGGWNKAIQAFVMCLLDYDYVVLDGAFLVHRPGIVRHSKRIPHAQNRMFRILKAVIIPELKRMYGSREGCM